MSAQDPDHGDGRVWDEWYARDGDDRPVWSGQPNPTLMAEASELGPGSALDVGCGEGADAIWLAQRGWRVRGIDPSGVALERAAAAARAAGVEVDWVKAGLLEMQGRPAYRQHPDGARDRPPVHYDLVTAHYAVLPRIEAATCALLAAVAPGGTLLLVHHDAVREHACAHGHDPADLLSPGDVARQLDGTWEVEAHETRPRAEQARSQGPHRRDVVLRARRLDAGARG